jgi:hypothetical protein
LLKGPNYEDKYYEDTIREDDTEPYYQENRFEVLEYWGVLDAKFAREVGMELPDMSYLSSIKYRLTLGFAATKYYVVYLNPFTPARIPFTLSLTKLTPTKSGV